MASLVLLACSIWLLGFRGDLGNAVGQASFWVPFIAGIAVVIFAGWCAFRLSVPGDRRWRWLETASIVGFVLWVSYLLFQLLQSDPSTWLGSLVHSYECAAFLLLLGAAPGLLMVVMLGRAAPTQRIKTGIMGFLSVGALGSIGIHLLCGGSNAAHSIPGHFLPIVVAAGIGGVIGQFFLKALR